MRQWWRIITSSSAAASSVSSSPLLCDLAIIRVYFYPFQSTWDFIFIVFIKVSHSDLQDRGEQTGQQWNPFFLSFLGRPSLLATARNERRAFRATWSAHLTRSRVQRRPNETIRSVGNESERIFPPSESNRDKNEGGKWNNYQPTNTTQKKTNKK